MTSIGEYAFEGCSSLTSIEIPSSVTSIGDHAFRRCSSLTSIEIPSSITRIGDGAFSGCSDALVIRGVKGSYAETYAKENSIPFVEIGADTGNTPGNGNNGESGANSSTGTGNNGSTTTKKSNKVTVTKNTYSLTASTKKQTIASLGAKASGKATAAAKGIYKKTSKTLTIKVTVKK